jgi:RimJ/RimL family protein N-acetyltransferase
MAEHRVTIDGQRIHSPRLELRPWSTEDAEAALAIYGSDQVTKWLSPAMGRVPDVASMEQVIAGWLAEELPDPAGRWALELSDTGALVGSAVLLPLPPGRDDLQIGWQLAPEVWGQGLAAEAGHAVAHYAFDSGVEELFAVVRPRNERGAGTARSIGMEWVGESEKYFDLRLQVYRLRKGELDVPKLPRIERFS